MNYIVFDLEATCWEGSRWEEMEIIEIGAVLLDGEHFQPMAEFEQFVRPLNNPNLTEFCKELTSIKQKQIDAAPDFQVAFDWFMDWIGDKPFKLCAWGDFDAKMVNKECEQHGKTLPSNFMGFMNLKELFARAYDTKDNIGLREAMRKLSMPFEGRLHRGIDDARNIAAVAQTILMLDD